MFGFFKEKAEKKDVDVLKEAVQTGFNSAKEDVGKINRWIKHLDSNDSKLKDNFLALEDDLSTVKEELENIKNIISIVGERPVFKQSKQVFNKQTLFKGVLNTVQTGVQTAFLGNLTTMERAIVFVLLNADMKLSYEDLSAMLGKRKATIRGQINSIKQKSEGLIEEVVVENNKKRVYIPEQVREILLKKSKVRAKKGKNKGDYE